ncbi:TPM domain-containing protein [uncultured Thiodictyon sp.]|uniref:TPM domain-containing protein n=1 Tax=uncultured Thiodictyon sp. TaxID=1846217 RepID=UPI0025DFEB64|nr:TPM domain-containing protein [uncultured Thiodictyon sp.]
MRQPRVLGRWGVLLWWVLLWALGVAPVRAEIAVPPLTARLTDLTQTLTPQQQQSIERDLADLETRKGAQIGVLIVPSTQPETIEQYARRVLDQWKLGRKGVDDGALLLVAKDDHRLRIETQYGLEGVIPDATAKRIIAEDITPAFKRGDFYGGIAAGLGRMIGLVDGEPLPPAHAPNRDLEAIDEYLGFLVFGVIFVGGVLRMILGYFLGATVTAGLVSVLLWLFGASLLAIAAAALISFVFVLLFGGIGGTRSRGGKGRRGNSSSGWWGGTGGGWSSSGGFSGGGGSGGGGGASGSW